MTLSPTEDPTRGCTWPKCHCDNPCPPEGWFPEQKRKGGHPGYKKLLEERLALHIEKSSGYGTGDDPFANFSAVASMTGDPRYLYPVHRTIEKLTRVLSLHAQGRVNELEEEFKDCASLLDCATAMLREDNDGTHS